MKKILLSRKNIWIALGLLAVAVRSFWSPSTVEKYYSRAFFLSVRRCFDALTGLLPFALVYVLAVVLLVLLILKIIKWVKIKAKWHVKLLAFLHSLLAFAGGVVFFFLLLWGYNYARIPLENTLDISPKPLSVSELREELDSVTAEVIRLRAMLPGVSDSVVSAEFLPAELEKTMRTELTDRLRQFGYPTPGQVRGRLLPKGILLRISTAGIYIPFTGEGHIDGGLHHLQLPFVVVHEMSHGYGFGDEGTCNFLAFLACTQSKNLYLRYVGQLYYWRYVASDYRDFEPEKYAEFKETLPAGMRNDVRAIQLEMEKYPDILPAVRDAAYDTYLRAQGISEGLKNYDRVIMLAFAWRHSARRNR